MAVQRAGEAEPTRPAAETSAEAAGEFPVRDYIGAMALELAQMARWDGDEALGRLLDSAAALAGQPQVRRPVEIAQPARVQPS